ncbi:hypothetical protein [Virgisporangium aurantiacum]|uniref:Uncharacterized protein n=1 Tax=Virgisporangium aurantiacum TaxID=175570 RepID=A0A8J4E1B9_9ACTN|nr:hypothetical protein [Virgisporangium aurantiacum]GIJ57864.1 hypothetical protein Vau01_053800 [Virgisporangium aurantiacum]
MTQLLDKLLGLTAKKETVSASCPPDTWLDGCWHVYSGDGTFLRRERRWGHTTPQCGAYYTYDSACLYCWQ